MEFVASKGISGQVCYGLKQRAIISRVSNPQADAASYTDRHGKILVAIQKK